ncbi:MAG: site-2 protease family protein [Xanthomonadaceae bacterium]|nr:site-2 protease family protein [Xanthomonadaceae bacterium]
MESFAHNLQMLSVQFVPFMMAVIFHEYAHGLMAERFGDTTAKDAGRLTLNPLPHIDWMGTVLFPLINMLSGLNILFGWAKPVPIDPTRFKTYRSGLFWVSFAGPLMNFLLAFVSAIGFCMMVKWAPQDFYLFEPLIAMTRVSVYLNIALGIFNLIPLPPLDGSKMIESFLSYNATRTYESIAPYSFFILLGLMFTGAFQILSAPINLLANLMLFLAGSMFGLGGLY